MIQLVAKLILTLVGIGMPNLKGAFLQTVPLPWEEARFIV